MTEILRKLNWVFAAAMILLGGYILLTDNYALMPYTQILQGLLLFVMGIQEFKKEHRGMAFILFGVCLFSFYVSVQYFSILN